MNTKTRFDLHLHTTRSDGALSQKALLRRCAQRGLHVVAITDHDAAPTVAPGRHQFGERCIQLVHGVELSVLHHDVELHMLCYFAGEVPQGFRECLRDRQSDRAQRFASAREKLGLDAPQGESVSWTRTHLAKELVSAGKAPNMHAAFDRALAYRHGIVRPTGVPVEQGLGWARDFGAITSWAHPNPDQAKAWAGELAGMGLWGLESARPGLGRAVRTRLMKTARRAGLQLTGGSDWHGHVGDVGVFSFPFREARPFVDALNLEDVC